MQHNKSFGTPITTRRSDIKKEAPYSPPLLIFGNLKNFSKYIR